MRKRNKLHRLGPVQQKILLLLWGGMALGLTRTPRQYFRVIKGINHEWEKINYWSLKKAIAALYRSKLIHEHKNPDGSLTMVLTEKGKQKVVTYNIDNMEIKTPQQWDKRWRMVTFDIPEKKRQDRDVLRETLKRLGFYEFQKSVFIHPYPCQDEMDYVIEFFNLRSYVRIITATKLDNELHLKKIFNLL